MCTLLRYDMYQSRWHCSIATLNKSRSDISIVVSSYKTCLLVDAIFCLLASVTAVWMLCAHHCDNISRYIIQKGGIVASIVNWLVNCMAEKEVCLGKIEMSEQTINQYLFHMLQVHCTTIKMTPVEYKQY